MPVARSEPPDPRVIAHVDLDCFYVQVEQRRHPELKGKPTAVVMYNPWKGGGIISVGYEARDAGVTRKMRGDDARKVCPDINLIQVPTHFGKADLTDYRDAGSEVVAVFSRGGVCERASIDEVYLDITEAAVARLQQSPPDALMSLSPQVLGTHIVGLGEDHDERMEVKDWFFRSALFASKSDQLLACGAMIIAELRTTVHEETGFTTSAGIAHNKMLAKQASGMHKPAQQTLIPASGAPGLLASLPIKKLKGLGGKLGKAVESDLGTKTVGDLLPYSESKLQDLYGTNTGTWLWRVARGMSGNEVEGRTLPKSHGCGKTFPGPKALKDLDSVAHWLSELSGELQERLDVDLQQNNRSARLLVCHAVDRKGDNPGKPFPSKSCVIRYGKEKIAHDALVLFKRALSEFCPQNLSPVKGENSSGAGSRWRVTALSLSAHNMRDASGTAPITQYFAAPTSTTHITTAVEPDKVITPPSSPSSVHSPSLASPSGADDSAQQDRFFNTINGDESVAPCSANDTLEPVNSNKRRKFLLMLDDDSRHTQDCKDEQRPVNRPRNGAGGAEDHETDPLGTPQFGVPGNPAECLPVLEFPEALSSVLSCDSTLVQRTVEGNLGRSLPNIGCSDGENLTEADIIPCSPLELVTLQGSEPDSRCAIGINEEGNRKNSELAASFDQRCESLRGATEQSPGQVSDSVPDREIVENCPPFSSAAIENYSQTATLSSSKLRSFPKSMVDNVTPGSTASQLAVSAGSSRRLVFQRVDDLWERSRPNSEPLSNSKKSSISSWNYKVDEIDEGVLSELPEEIQHELRNQLRLKRPKTRGRSTISDFFKTNSSSPK